MLRDINTVHGYVEKLLEVGRENGRVTYNDFHHFADQPGYDRQALHAAHNFISNGMQSIFMQDGNSFILKPDDLVSILEHLRNAFPKVDRITSYARSQSIAKVSDEDLARIAQAGLNRIHIGMESGSDKVLKAVKKGVDKATQIEAGQKIKRAGMQLSEYWMPGLGGRTLSRENALETADALNQINPDFIRLRTLGLPDSAPIAAQAAAGEFEKIGEVETAAELLLMLESLKGITSTVRSDHTLNLLMEVDGKFPEERETVLAPLQSYLKLQREEQMLFSIGRRTHRMSHLADLQDVEKRRSTENICHELGATVENMDDIVDSIMKRFI